MKKIVFALGAIFITSMVSGQFSGQVPSNMSAGGSNDAGISASIQQLLGPISDADQKRKNEWEEFSGSPYTAFEFEPTKVYYRDEYQGDIYYRYNAYNEEIEIKEDPAMQGVRAIGKNKAITVMVDGKPMSFKTFIDKNGRTLNGYLTTLQSSGPYTLYKRVNVKFTQGKKAENSFVKAVPSKFSHFIEYYMEVDGVDQINEIKLKNKKLVEMVGEDQQQALKKYLKENKLNISKENDLISAFVFLNQ